MRIELLKVYRYSLPLREPLVLRGVPHTRREGLLVEVVTEADTSGWGEVAPLPGFSRESLEEAEQQVLKLRSNLAGQDVDVLARWQEYPVPAGNALAPSVRFGIGLALSEASRVAERRLSTPETAHDFISVNALMTCRDVDAARALAAAGYRSIKLKVGRASVGEDVRTVREVAEAVGEDVRLRLDANRSWSFEDAAVFARGVRDLPHEYIEEPLADAGRLRELVERTGAPVALDESLAGIPPDQLQDHRYAAAVVLKPAFLGGLAVAAEYAKQALGTGMKPIVSAAFESGVGIRAMALFASEVGLGDTPMGLDTYRWFAEDIWEPRLRLKRGGFSIAGLLDEGRRIRVELLSEIQ